MKKSAKFLIAASVLALGTALSSADANANKKEKCFGIAKAGKNDCAARDASHSCATYSAKDGEPNDWILLPAGTCERIVGGSVGEESGL